MPALAGRPHGGALLAAPAPRRDGTLPPRAGRRGRRRAVQAQARTSVVETEAAGAWVAAPARQQPRGVVHFLGGAFAGAAPQLAYELLIRWLADAGYTVVATPYAVTFRHLDCAASVHQAFQGSLAALRGSSQAWMAPERAPIHGVGHSNGALLHALIGAREQPAHASNILLSFNNKQVKEAIPVPLDGLKDAVRNARASSLTASLPTTDYLLDRAVALSAGGRAGLDRRTARALKPALDQVGSVLDEVEQGYTDFVPTPAQSRDIIAGGYRLPATLLLQFSDDSTDETPLLAAAITRPGTPGPTVAKLPGSHVTPCGGDITWQVGPVFTPVDALALAGKALVQADLRRTARRMVAWLDEHS